MKKRLEDPADPPGRNEDEMECRAECSLAGGFTLWEKIYAQSTFIGMGVIGTVGVAMVDWPRVLPYILIYWYGIPGIVQRHLVCPRCPHLYQYGDCLQLPAAATKWFIKKRKRTPFSPLERFLFLSIFTLIPVYPIYWLLQTPTLLIPFLITGLMWYGGQFLYFCRRCRVRGCPFNRVKWGLHDP